METLYYKPLKLVLGKGDYTANGGVHLLHFVIEQLDLRRSVDRLLGRPASNRGYSNSQLVMTLVHLLHIGGDRVWDVKVLRDDFMASGPPSRQALERLLRRMSERAPLMERLLDDMVERCMCDVAQPGPGERPGRMVDIDEQEFDCGKECAETNRKGKPGMTQTLAFDSATGTWLAGRLDPGNSVPGTGRSGVLATAHRRLAAHGGISVVRADAAYCNKDILNWCMDNGVGFLVRHNFRRGKAGVLEGMDEKAWKLIDENPMRRQFEAVVIPHRKESCRESHWLHLYREVGPGVQQDLFEPKVIGIATSLDVRCPKELRKLCNMRGDQCENRIKEYSSDLAGDKMPSSRLEPNRAWTAINAIAYNLFLLMRRVMFPGWRPRFKLFRVTVCQAPCRLVKTGGRMYLSVRNKRMYHEMVRWEKMLYMALAP